MRQNRDRRDTGRRFKRRGDRNNRGDRGGPRRKLSGDNRRPLRDSQNPRFRRFKRRDDRDDRRGGKRPSLRKMRDNKKKSQSRDLNKQINEYWLKGGNKNLTQNKVAHEKLNDEMDNYWKNAKNEQKKQKKQQVK